MKQKVLQLSFLFSLLVLLPQTVKADEQSLDLTSEMNVVDVSKCAICSAEINVEGSGLQQKRGCCKESFCQICARSLSVGSVFVNGLLSVNGSFTVNGVNLSSPAAIGTALADAGVTIPGASLGYAYIYTLTQPAPVAQNAPIIYSSNGPLSGVLFTPPSPTITVVAAGTYLITFSVSGTQANQFGISVNGAAPATPAGTVYGAGAGTEQNTGQAILTLAAGSTIQIWNYLSSGGAVSFAMQGGTQQNVLSSVVIQRLA